MDHLIDRQAALNEIAEWMLEYGALNEKRERDALQHVARGIKKLPSAQTQTEREKMADLIDRQAAIGALHMHLMYRMGTDSNKKRLDEWINGLPSAQETHEERTETHACDLIDRQAAIDALEKVAELFPWRIPGNRDSYDRYNEAWNDAIGRAEIEIEKLPSAQPELEPKREKGHWQISDAYPHNVYCSECHARFAQTHWAVWEDGSLPRRFCPSCGKEMELTEP